MRVAPLVLTPWFATFLFWSTFTACLTDVPDPPGPPAARVVTSWDPLECHDARQRVVVELEDEDGFEISSSAACRVGGLTLDARSWGIYTGRVYSWMLGEPISSVTRVTLTVDAPVIRWQVATP